MNEMMDETQVRILHENAAILASCQDEELAASARAVLELRRLTDALKRSGRSLVGDVLRPLDETDRDEPPLHEHFPEDDVIDYKSEAQFYFHRHRGIDGEAGHFHTYLFAKGMPEETAAEVRRLQPKTEARDSFVHFCAIGMSQIGLPLGIFTTNRWVCHEAYLPAEPLIELLPRFRVEHANPSYALNRGVTVMMIAFRPQIIEAIRRRDRFIDDVINTYNCPREDALNDGGREVTSSIPITLDGQEYLLDNELRQRGIRIDDV